MHGGAFAHSKLPFFEDLCLIQGSTFSKQMVFHVFSTKCGQNFDLIKHNCKLSYESVVFSGYPQDRVWAISGLKNFPGVLRVGKSSTINSAFWVFLFLVEKAKEIGKLPNLLQRKYQKRTFFQECRTRQLFVLGLVDTPKKLHVNISTQSWRKFHCFASLMWAFFIIGSLMSLFLFFSNCFFGKSEQTLES